MCERRCLYLFLFLVSLIARANLSGNAWIFHTDSKDERFAISMVHRGNPLLNLEELVTRFSIEMAYNPETFQITLRNPRNKTSASLHTFSRKVSAWNYDTELSRPIFFDGAKPQLPIDFGDRVLRPLLTGKSPPPARKFPTRTRVLIDPGHGGNDFGAAVNVAGGKGWVYEKDLTLELGRELRDELRKLKIDAELTREDDRFLTLPERTELANRLKADVFVSVHLNADEGKKGRGFEVYVLSVSGADAAGRAAVARENMMIPEELGDGMDRALADLRAQANLERSLAVAKGLTKTLETHRKAFGSSIKMGPFYVLYGAEMPAVLLELGFLTNAEDRAFLSDRQKRAGLLGGLAKDIVGVLAKEKTDGR